jgi:uncharacterized membrane protein
MLDAAFWRRFALALTLVGLASSAYLAYHAALPDTRLYCPTGGPFDCGVVTSSPYSVIFGVNVAYLGLAWFIVVLMILLLRRTGLLLPICGLGAAFVAYMMAAELFLIHAICVYCTVAHAAALLLLVPALKLLDEEE